MTGIQPNHAVDRGTIQDAMGCQAPIPRTKVRHRLLQNVVPAAQSASINFISASYRSTAQAPRPRYNCCRPKGHGD